MTGRANHSVVVDTARVTRAVVGNQALWTAGYSLTTGGFLTYFGYELGATGLMIAVLLMIPETVGIVSLAARWVIQQAGNRKGVWIACSLLARFLSLGIPLLAFPTFRPLQADPLWLMIGFLAGSQAVQSVAYLSYLSWLADLVPEQRWGRFFAARNISKLVVLLAVPVAGGLLRDRWRTLVSQQHLSPQTALLVYVVVFSVGVALLLLSMFPLLRLPNVPVRSDTVRLAERRLIVEALRNRSMRFLLIHNWWLAVFNGLTQAVWVGYLFRALNVQLAMFYVLANVMHLVKIPVSWATGRLCDRFGNKAFLFWGVLIAGSAMIFWLLATPEHWWWVFGAFVLWGAFAAANIAGRNLALKLSPRSDNTAHLALFRQVAGLLAGLSGLLGGIWLDRLQRSGFAVHWGTYRIEGYQVLFLISLIGRLSSVLWILPIHEPGARSLRWILRGWMRVVRVRSAARKRSLRLAD